MLTIKFKEMKEALAKFAAEILTLMQSSRVIVILIAKLIIINHCVHTDSLQNCGD